MSGERRLHRARMASWCGLLATAAAALVAGCNGKDPRTGSTLPMASAAPAVPRMVAIARGTVELPGGLLEVTAAQDGIVEAVAVQEGGHVKRGQMLLQLSSDRLRQDLAMARAELKLAHARQAAQQVRLPAARATAARMVEAAQAEAIDAQRADEALQTLRELEAGLIVAAAESSLAEEKLAQVQAQTQRLALLAAQDATVLKVLAQPGTRVSALSDKPLLTLLPTKALRVRAEVNETYVARVVVGMRASIHLDSEVSGAAVPTLPGARVVRLSPVFGASRLEDETQARGIVRVVECFLEFDQAPALRIGQTVRVEFHE